MSSHPKTSREDALRLAEQKKGARRRRTRRIRHVVVTLAVAAFIGPLGFIWAESSSSGATTTTAKATSTGTTSSQSTQSTAPVTTQQS